MTQTLFDYLQARVYHFYNGGIMQEPQQKLLFVLGKGGVGRTSVSVALGMHYAQKGENVLLVQWALKDSISILFNKSAAYHDAKMVYPNLHIMNYNTDDSIREYFVDHLGFKLLYRLVIENNHVKKLISAAPGVSELFFLGRLFWLVQLAPNEKGLVYDRIIVDCPAMGHGCNLFSIPATVASFGMSGPIAYESERVSKLLADKKMVGSIIVTIPEELPIEETLEFMPKINHDLGRYPLYCIINKSLTKLFPNNQHGFDNSAWFDEFMNHLFTTEAKNEANVMLGELKQRNIFEKFLINKINTYSPAICLPDMFFSGEKIHGLELIKQLAFEFSSVFNEQDVLSASR